MANNQFYIIILLDFIEYDNDLAIYHNKPFTGLVIEHKNCVVVNKFEYKEGIKVTEKKTFFPSIPNVEIINVNNIVERDGEGAVIYNGLPLSGLIYYFKDKYCYFIQEYEAGWENSELGIGNNGRLSRLYRNGNDYSECIEWENDQLRNYEINISLPDTRRCSTLSLGFSPTNQLNKMTVQDDFYLVSNRVIDDVWYSDYLIFEDLQGCQIAESLLLSGNNVDDEFFKKLIDRGILTDCNEIILPEHIIDPKVLQKYLPMSSIQKLTFRYMRDSKISKASYQRCLSNYDLTFIN